MAPRVSSSQSTMSLAPSASMEPISDWTTDSNRMAKPNRSIYKPDIGRTPRQGSSYSVQLAQFPKTRDFFFF